RGDQRGDRRRAQAARRADLAPLRREVARWEKEAARLQGVLATIDRGLAVPGVFETRPTEAADLARKRAKAAELLDAAETNWLAAAEKLEALG
ncbi:MAG: hypothetical protein MI723_01130, partial [Caulobacterales bacterium]|nr:hypothetical protein [Caulobacterales bacterium]